MSRIIMSSIRLRLFQSLVREPFRTIVSQRQKQLVSVSKSFKGRRKIGLVLASTLGIVGYGSLNVPSSFGSVAQETSDESTNSQSDDGENLPLEYDVKAIQRYWRKRPLEIAGRSLEITSVLVPYLVKLIFWEILIRRKIIRHEGLQKKYAVRLREILTSLGPSFIKFGQAISIRPDLLPTSFLQELQKLCDEVPSFPTKDAIKVIEEELGQKVTELFCDMSEFTQPIAAASLGQVYKLHLKNYRKDEVAVKVQRPDMLRCVLRDLYIMRFLATVFEKVKSVVTNQRAFDVALLDTFATASLNELDYLKEASNQERFQRELVPKLGGRVCVPKVFHDITTKKVLVTEWIDGVKLASSPKETINRLVPVGLECFLMQLLETGFFHADPHPGNLLVTKNGKLALIDFGLCAEVPLPDTKNMTLTIVHMMQGDVLGMIDDAIELKFLPPDVDRKKLHATLQIVYDNATLAMQDEISLAAINKARYKAVASRRKKFLAVSSELNKIFFEFPFYVPEYFALITRALIVLEGIALSGNPDFDLFSSAYPYAFRRAVNLFGVNDLSQIATEAARARNRWRQKSSN